ncbi:MAG: hypothetical protein IPQ04_15435 [Saprospiraceae bacterium]|nr:hypothetical protein [Saprospiraceae bacterium]
MLPIHPNDAAKNDIQEHDPVIIESARGKITVNVHPTDEVKVSRCGEYNISLPRTFVNIVTFQCNRVVLQNVLRVKCGLCELEEGEAK